MSEQPGRHEPMRGTLAADRLDDLRVAVELMRLKDGSLPLVAPANELTLNPRDIENQEYARLVSWIQLIRASGLGKRPR
ncbi:hypothetical protein LCH21_00585 [Patescibacteria group bacterium]|nr:hypothetical protein [Patescibacteria group bacterium]MCA9335472.1 hypothetical protein [Candidatus Saccharibacteria bacterium]